MSKKNGKLALYEAIGKSCGGLMKGDKPVKSSKVDQELPLASEPQAQKVSKPAGVAKKTTSFQVVLDRNGFFILVTSVVILMLISFLIGQKSGSTEVATGTVDVVSSGDTTGSRADIDIDRRVELPTDRREVSDDRASNKAPIREGNNVILVMQYQVSKDLEPARDYFARNGIELEIKRKITGDDTWYYLISVDRFKSVAKGTKGGDLMQKIKKIGLGYKAPEDYETFGTRPFQDAYGFNLKNLGVD